jgi:chromosome condensin MukBEF MukE localization factor
MSLVRFAGFSELKTLRDEFSYFWLRIRKIRAVKRIIFMGLIYAVGRVYWVKLSPMRIAERDRTVLWDPRPIYSRIKQLADAGTNIAKQAF